MRSTFTRSITALILVIAMAVGMTASLSGKAQAATPINIAYAAGDDAKINGGPVYNVNAFVGVATTITTVKPTRSGCNFLGWTTTKNSGRIDYKSGQSVTFTKATTLWPVWNSNIAYAADDGKFANGSPVMNVSVTLGKATTVPTSVPQKTGYTCVGWNTTKKSSTIQYKPGAPITYDRQKTFWPVWKANTIKITYNINGGTWKNGDTAQSFTYGSSYTLTPPDCVKTGYTLAGWNTKADGSGTMYQKGQRNIQFTSNTTLYAIWTGNVGTITYNANGGQAGSVGSNGMKQSFTAGKAITLTPPNFYRTGCELLGFAPNSHATSAIYKKGNSYVFDVNTTLYAVWRASITFDANGGTISSGSSTQNFIVGTSATLKAPSVSRSGYRFLGYSTKPNDTAGKYQNGSSIPFTTNTTLYAIWEVTPYKLPDGATDVSRLQTQSFITAYEDGNVRYGADQHYANYIDDPLIDQLYNGFKDRVSKLGVKAIRNFLDGYQIKVNGVNVEAFINNWKRETAADYLHSVNPFGTCGAFAAVNTYLYLSKQFTSNNSLLVNLELKKLYDIETKTLEGVGSIILTKGDYWGSLTEYIYTRTNQKVYPSWVQYEYATKDSIDREFRRMLGQEDLPVIMSYSSDEYLPCYHLSSDGKKLEGGTSGFTSHYFVVTAYFRYQGEYWCQISSCGDVEYFKVSDWLSKRDSSFWQKEFNCSSYMLLWKQ